jgi:hypothetical protein
MNETGGPSNEQALRGNVLDPDTDVPESPSKPPEGSRFHDELALTRWLVGARSKQRDLNRASVVLIGSSCLLLSGTIVCVVLNVAATPKTSSPDEFEFAAWFALCSFMLSLASLAWPRASLDPEQRKDYSVRPQGKGQQGAAPSLAANAIPWALVILAFLALAVASVLGLSGAIQSS